MSFLIFVILSIFIRDVEIIWFVEAVKKHIN